MRCWPQHIQSWSQAKRIGREFREKQAQPDKNNDAIAGVGVVKRKVVQPGVSAIK